MNNKGKDKLTRLSHDIKKQEIWNYNIKFDDAESVYRPPSHIPVLPTQTAKGQRLRTGKVIETKK